MEVVSDITLFGFSLNGGGLFSVAMEAPAIQFQLSRSILFAVETTNDNYDFKVVPVVAL
jgi:hypothetical protein